MFDNPDKELKKLEDQLLALETPEDRAFDAVYEDILKEFGQESQSSKKQTTSAPRKKAPQGQKKGTKKSSKKRKKKSVTGLVTILCLEIAGILGILLWWIFRLL